MARMTLIAVVVCLCAFTAKTQADTAPTTAPTATTSSTKPAKPRVNPGPRPMAAPKVAPIPLPTSINTGPVQPPAPSTLETLPPLPTALPNVNMPIPAGLGVNIHFTDPQPGEMAMLSEGGFKFVRMDFDWAKIESRRGIYDFGAYDRLLAALAPRGIRAIFILDYANPLHDDNRSPYTDAGRLAFARWVSESVQHFKGHGIIWEMYNEPNISPFWRPKPNPDDYVKLALEVGKAIRAVAPDELYVGPACSTMDFPFLETCFSGGLLDYWSAITVHPYRGQEPETVAEDYRKLRLLAGRFVPVGRSVPISSGEWGYSSASPSITEDRQGTLLARQWLTNLSNDVPLSIWYDWHDDGTDPKETEHHFGTVANAFHADRDPVYDPKPAYRAAKTLTTQLNGFRFNKRVWLDRGDDYILLFTRAESPTTATTAPTTSAADANVCTVAYTSSRDRHTVLVPASGGSFKVVSHLGEEQSPLSSGSDGLRIVLDETPQYIKPEQPNDTLNKLADWTRMPMEVVAHAPGVARVGTSEVSITRGQEHAEYETKLQLPGMPAVSQRTAVVVTNPLKVTLLPPEAAGLPVHIANPSGDAFFGTARLVEKPGVRASLRLEAGQNEQTITLPLGPMGPSPRPVKTAVEVLDDLENRVLRTPTLRFVPIALAADKFAVKAEGDPKVVSSQSLAPAGEYESSSPGAPAVTITYLFDAGWKYLCLQPTDDALGKIEGKPASIGMWVLGDASGNIPRMRFTDETGQTFQPDAPKLTIRDWQYIQMPLDGKSGGHWGGANDGIVHYPIRLETLFLLDSADRGKTSGKVSLSAPCYIYIEDETPPLTTTSATAK